MLDADEPILRTGRSDELIQLRLDRGAISVLRVLDHENHEESHDRRPGVDDELPCIGEMKYRAHDGPHQYDQDGQKKTDGSASLVRDPSGDHREKLVHERAVFLVGRLVPQLTRGQTLNSANSAWTVERPRVVTPVPVPEFQGRGLWLRWDPWVSVPVSSPDAIQSG